MIYIDPQFSRHAVKAIVIGISFIVVGFATFFRSRVRSDLPVSSIRSLSAGASRVKGTSSSLQQLQAPFSEDEQVNMFRLIISRRAGVTNNWVPVINTAYWSIGHWSIVDDNGDHIIIDPKKFSLSSKVSFTKKVYPWKQDQKVLDICRTFGFEGKKKFFKIEVIKIMEGDSLEIVGDATPHNNELVLTNSLHTACVIYNLTHPLSSKDIYLWSIGGFLLLCAGVFVLVVTSFSLDSRAELGWFIGSLVALIILFVASLIGFVRRKK